MAIHMINTHPSRYNVKPGTELTAEVGTWEVDDRKLDSDAICFRTAFRSNNYRYGFGIAGPTSLHNDDRGNVRQETSAYMFGLATVLSDTPQRQPREIMIADGDLLVDASAGYVIRVHDAGRFSSPRLEIVEAPAAAADRSAHVAKINKDREGRPAVSEAWLCG